MAVTTTVRLLLVDDDPLVRAGLRMLLQGAPDIDVVGEAEDGAAALHAVDVHLPHVVLMDLRMPRMDGLEATERLRARPHAPEVVVLTTFDADEDVLRALRAGAGGFLLKDTPPEELVRAIHRVAAGDGMLSPAVTRRLMAHVADDDGATRRASARERLAELSPREHDVALALGEGLANAEIGARLGMGVPTVKAHVSRVLEKLDLTNRVQVALLVREAWPDEGWARP